LITTDVTAEGLDLQASERVVHYDLPWNQVRLDQRNGRAIRRGSPHTAVEVVRFDPPPSLEERLASGARLARKAALPPAWGLGAGGRRVWRWREEVKAALGEGPAVRGVATIEGPEAGLLAGFVLSRPDDLGACDAIVSVGWLSRTREWSEDAAVVEPRLLEAARAIQIQAVDTGEIGRALEAILPLVRQRLRDAHTGCWHRERPSLSARHLLRRLTSWASIAIRERDGQALSRIEGAMRFVAAGHSVGEERLIERLAALPDIEARRQLPTLPEPAPEWGALEPRLLGMVVFRVGESGRLTVSS
jgi:hypothetical protein